MIVGEKSIVLHKFIDRSKLSTYIIYLRNFEYICILDRQAVIAPIQENVSKKFDLESQLNINWLTGFS